MAETKTIYAKLAEARAEFHRLDLKKSGHNKFAGYRYFELADFAFDTEDMGDHVVIFDVLKWAGEDITDYSFEERSQILFYLVDLASEVRMKETVGVDALGIDLPGFYDNLKFYASATCRVASVHPTKRSIGLELADEQGMFDFVGNCTIPANYKIPSVGDLVEVKYLYAYRNGSIYQPQYKGIRTDLDPSAAVTRQLKYKE